MEPMTLGSPTHSPPGSPNISFLPPFLMGEINTPTTPRTNSLSPTKGRALAFGSPTNQTPPEQYNKQQQGILLNQSGMMSPPRHNQSILNSVPTSPNMSYSNKLHGPPTQGLFDTLKSNERSMNRSYQHQDIAQPSTSAYHNSYANQSGINNSVNYNNQSMNGSSLWQDNCPSEEEYWVTVFGFPASAASTVLTHFSLCGTVLDKVYPTQGNWAHIRYSTRAEKARALALNGRQLMPGTLVGVIECAEPPRTGHAIAPLSPPQRIPAHPLCPAVLPSTSAPERSNGFVSKAMEYVFGW